MNEKNRIKSMREFKVGEFYLFQYLEDDSTIIIHIDNIVYAGLLKRSVVKCDATVIMDNYTGKDRWETGDPYTIWNISTNPKFYKYE
jgi:hypothetical protein